MLPGKMNPKVDLLLRHAKTWQPEMTKLRAIILGCGLTEEIKWGQPCYTFQKTNIVLIMSLKKSCALLFCQGALLKDKKRILIQPTENSQSARQLRFANLPEIIALEAVVKFYLGEAIEAEKAGLKVSFKKIEEFKIPEEFQAHLDKNPALTSAFKALTPGRQRSYLICFSAPKQAKTREALIEKYRQQILDGIGLMDEYQSKKMPKKSKS